MSHRHLHDRLNRRERILDAMIELIEQQALCLCRRYAIRNVPEQKPNLVFVRQADAKGIDVVGATESIGVMLESRRLAGSCDPAVDPVSRIAASARVRSIRSAACRARMSIMRRSRFDGSCGSVQC